MPQAPTSSGMPPSDVTASTIVSAPCSRAIAASSRTGFTTPVDVSAWTIATTSAGVAFSCVAQRVGIARPAPLDVEPRDRRAVALAHLREAIAEVAGDDRRSRACPPSRDWRPPFPCPDVPVPETANANDPSAARNTRPSRARTSSSSAIISGSRWLSVGAAIARITRGAVRLGPGPSRMRSLSGSRLMREFPRNAPARRAARE